MLHLVDDLVQFLVAQDRKPLHGRQDVAVRVHVVVGHVGRQRRRLKIVDCVLVVFMLPMFLRLDFRRELVRVQRRRFALNLVVGRHVVVTEIHGRVRIRLFPGVKNFRLDSLLGLFSGSFLASTLFRRFFCRGIVVQSRIC